MKKIQEAATDRLCPISDCGATIRIEQTGDHRQILIRAHENAQGGVCRASESPPAMWGA